MKKDRKKNRSFYRVVIVSFLSGLLPVILISAVWLFKHSVTVEQRNFQVLQKQSEESLRLTLELSETAYRMLELSLEHRLRFGMQLFQEEYERKRQPQNLDLAGLKAQLGDDIDVYVIDREAVVIMTTFEADLGLDFKQWPEFYDNLQLMMATPDFHLDVLALETISGRLRLYAYQMTADQKYLLELGIASSAFKNFMGQLDPAYFSEILKSLNPSLRSVRFYGIDGSHVVADPGFDHIPSTDPKIKEVWGRDEPIEVFDRQNNTLIRYFYFNPGVDRLGSIREQVVKLEYSMEGVRQSILAAALVAVILSCLLILAGILIASFLARRLASPVHVLVDKVNRIASGDYSTDVPEDAKNEIWFLQRSINTMKNSLVNAINQLKVSEEQIRKHNDQLEALVEERSRKLVESEKMAALSSLVIGVAHELNTPLGICITAASFIEDGIAELANALAAGSLTVNDCREHVTKSKESMDLLSGNLERTALLVNSFKDIAVESALEAKVLFAPRAYFEQLVKSLSSVIKHVSLDFVFEIPHDLQLVSHPAVFLRILSQLISNSAVHAFGSEAAGRIVISLEKGESATAWMLRFYDNGRSMSRHDRRHAFEPFYTSRRGTHVGLGLHIVYNMVRNILEGDIIIIDDDSTGNCLEIRFSAEASWISV